MASTEKRRKNKVGVGLAANLPTITNPDVSFGDEYFATDTGLYHKVTAAIGGTKQWTSTGLGQGIQVGNFALIAGTRTISVGVTITAASRIYVSRNGAPGGGTAIGLLNVRGLIVGGPGVGTFIVEALAEANQAVVAADTSTIVFMIVG